ncbi:MAG: hypothetical protein H8E13_01740 [Actinobacteria bacterium]|nr:hypothetical protein [Actinomycetota bacterium]
MSGEEYSKFCKKNKDNIYSKQFMHSIKWYDKKTDKLLVTSKIYVPIDKDEAIIFESKHIDHRK